MGDNFPHVIEGILGRLAGAGTSAGRRGSGAASFLGSAVTQHIWARLPQNRWEPVGVSAGGSEPWP